MDDRKGAAAKEQAAEIEGLDEAERELLLEAIDDLATGGARTDLAASRFKCLMKRALWRSYVGLLRALRLMRKLLRKQGFVPKLLVTDKLRSYGSAFRQLQLTCPHEQELRKNNRAANSRQPIRQ